MDHINSISFIGSGNVATHLAIAVKKAGYDVKEIYSLNHENAIELARKVGCTAIRSVEEIDQSVDLFLIAVPDEAIEKLIKNFPLVNGIVAHTSGITPMEVLKQEPRFGVFYPLQTFSKQRELDISAVPFCIEASSGDVLIQLKEIAMKLSKSVFGIDSNQRQYLHLTAVLVNNYSNYLFQTAYDILDAKNIDHSILMPLIEETISKIKDITPDEAQTGPASRNDIKTIEKHLMLLNEYPQYIDLYKIFAEQLIKKYNE